jgi:hypothetical protein
MIVDNSDNFIAEPGMGIDIQLFGVTKRPTEDGRVPKAFRKVLEVVLDVVNVANVRSCSNSRSGIEASSLDNLEGFDSTTDLQMLQRVLRASVGEKFSVLYGPMSISL